MEDSCAVVQGRPLVPKIKGLNNIRIEICCFYPNEFKTYVFFLSLIHFTLFITADVDFTQGDKAPPPARKVTTQSEKRTCHSPIVSQSPHVIQPSLWPPHLTAPRDFIWYPASQTHALPHTNGNHNAAHVLQFLSHCHQQDVLTSRESYRMIQRPFSNLYMSKS